MKNKSLILCLFSVLTLMSFKLEPHFSSNTSTTITTSITKKKIKRKKPKVKKKGKRPFYLWKVRLFRITSILSLISLLFLGFGAAALFAAAFGAILGGSIPTWIFTLFKIGKIIGYITIPLILLEIWSLIQYPESIDQVVLKILLILIQLFPLSFIFFV